MKYILSLAIIFYFGLSVFAQTVLTNADVIDMVKGGLSSGIIAAKIRGSVCNFDTSTEALKKLADAKIPDDVVVAMIDKDSKDKDAAESKQRTSSEDRDQIREQGSLADIKGKQRVFIMTDYLKGRDLIAKELAKAKFEVVDKVELAEFVIQYAERTEVIGATGNVYGSTASVQNKTQLVGVFSVVTVSSDPNSSRLRNIYSTTKYKYFIWSAQPSKAGAEQFIKDLNKIPNAELTNH